MTKTIVDYNSNFDLKFKDYYFHILFFILKYILKSVFSFSFLFFFFFFFFFNIFKSKSHIIFYLIKNKTIIYQESRVVL